jgi:rSAM/selenodomain-associated transferase 1
LSASGRDVLLVFLKTARPGAVKTRLAATLGKAAAAELYRVLAEAEVRRTAPRGGEYERRFCFTPKGARAAMKAWFPGEVFEPQEGADLGARMARAFDQAFRGGARRVAIIGGDVPAVSREIVREAFRSLQDHDVVLGPARDGGYYLLALSRPRPGLFRGIAWGTSSVLAATVKKATGLAVRLLEPLTDIDTLEDLRTEWRRLAPLLAARPALRRGIARALGRSPRAPRRARVRA